MKREYPQAPLPAVAALVVREDAVLLVLRHNPPHAGEWSVPGGAQDVGEGVTAALRREVREETGLRVDDLRLLDVGDIVERDETGRVRYHYLVVYFRARPTGGTLAPGDDVDDVRWVDLEGAASLGISSRLRELIVEALST
jgi:ADP-ribose pyrophosphatase YjhB (NUDIX family)